MELMVINSVFVVKGLGKCHGKLFLGMPRHLSVCGQMISAYFPGQLLSFGFVEWEIQSERES